MLASRINAAERFLPELDRFPALVHAIDATVKKTSAAVNKSRFYDHIGDLVVETVLSPSFTYHEETSESLPYYTSNVPTACQWQAGSCASPGNKNVLLVGLGVPASPHGIGDYALNGEGFSCQGAGLDYATYDSGNYREFASLTAPANDGAWLTYYRNSDGTGLKVCATGSAVNTDVGTLTGLLAGNTFSAVDTNIATVGIPGSNKPFRGFYVFYFQQHIPASILTAAAAWMAQHPGWLYPGFAQLRP